MGSFSAGRAALTEGFDIEPEPKLAETARETPTARAVCDTTNTPAAQLPQRLLPFLS
jgi:hypothetical protein